MEELLKEGDLALTAFMAGHTKLALSILTMGTGRSPGRALLLLHDSEAACRAADREKTPKGLLGEGQHG